MAKNISARELTDDEVLLVSGGNRTDGFGDNWGELTWGEQACFLFGEALWGEGDNWNVSSDIMCGTNMTGDNPNAPGTNNGY